MYSHLLKRQELFMLALVGLKLVPLVEILCTALIVTLKRQEQK